ncbi:unnamed protein product, partial [Ectocarpus sp. 12 AP-2014]
GDKTAASPRRVLPLPPLVVSLLLLLLLLLLLPLARLLAVPPPLPQAHPLTVLVLLPVPLAPRLLLCRECDSWVVVRRRGEEAGGRQWLRRAFLLCTRDVRQRTSPIRSLCCWWSLRERLVTELDQPSSFTAWCAGSSSSEVSGCGEGTTPRRSRRPPLIPRAPLPPGGKGPGTSALAASWDQSKGSRASRGTGRRARLRRLRRRDARIPPLPLPLPPPPEQLRKERQQQQVPVLVLVLVLLPRHRRRQQRQEVQGQQRLL